jgi:hypothetical protein
MSCCKAWGAEYLIEGKPAEVQLQWDANTEEDLAGYRLYQNRVSFDGKIEEGTKFIEEIPAGTETSKKILITEPGKYFWVVTSFDKAGNMSGPSNEATETYISDTTPPAPPQNNRTIKVTVIIEVPE